MDEDSKSLSCNLLSQLKMEKKRKRLMLAFQIFKQIDQHSLGKLKESQYLTKQNKKLNKSEI